MSGMWKGARPAPRERLLVCLDLQRGNLAPGQAPDRCVVNCRRVLAHAREADWRIVHVHTRRADSAEARPIAGLEPLLSEAVVYRIGGSAFSSRAFRLMVAGMASCELVIIGYSAGPSCLATALIAYDQDLGVTVVEDAVCSTSLDQETRDAIGVLTRQVARPFIGMMSADMLVGAPRLLRAV
jgi:nicotinamidase-related amidase